MDAVYPLFPRGEHIEYSYALLKKFTSIQNVFTVGEAFEPAIHIPHTDNQVPSCNIWEKALAACLDDRVSDPFLLISDDHFFIQPVDIGNYPNYYAFNISEYPYKTYNILGLTVDISNNPYWMLVKKTHDLLGDVPFYNVHCPVIIHKQKFIDTFEAYREHIYSGIGLLVKTTLLHPTSHPTVQMDDYKAKAKESLAEIRHNAKGRHIISCADGCDAIFEFLSEYL